MSSVPVWHKIKTFVCPSGKRRRSKRIVSQTVTVMPPKPAYPPKPVRAPIAALTAPEGLGMLAIEQRVMEQISAGRVGEMVRSFGDLYRSVDHPAHDEGERKQVVVPGRTAPAVRPAPDPVTRVILRSDNPEIDQAIVAGTSWLPKKLVRPDSVDGLTPVGLPSLGSGGLKLTVPMPVKASVVDSQELPGVVVREDSGSASVALLDRFEEDTQDLLITDEWRDMFRTETAHVCRGCSLWGPGIMADDGRWICGRCYSAGRY